MPMKPFLPVLLATATAGVPLAAKEAPGADAVLAAYHAAVGAIPSTGTVDIRYAYSGAGLEGYQEDIADLNTGAFVETTQADIVGKGKGFDGRTPWMRDTSGANTPQQGGDRIPVAVNEAYRIANLWWRPGYAGATITYNGPEVLDGSSAAPAGHLRHDALRLGAERSKGLVSAGQEVTSSMSKCQPRPRPISIVCWR